MIKVRIVSRNEKLFSAFEASGHAGLSEKGKDIVCSAVTILLKTALMVLNSVSENTKEFKVEQTVNADGFMAVKVKNFTEKDEPRLKYLLEFLSMGLMLVKAEFSDYLDLKIESK